MSQILGAKRQTINIHQDLVNRFLILWPHREDPSGTHGQEESTDGKSGQRQIPSFAYGRSKTVFLGLLSVSRNSLQQIFSFSSSNQKCLKRQRAQNRKVLDSQLCITPHPFKDVGGQEREKGNAWGKDTTFQPGWKEGTEGNERDKNFIGECRKNLN